METQNQKLNDAQRQYLLAKKALSRIVQREKMVDHQLVNDIGITNADGTIPYYIHDIQDNRIFEEAALKFAVIVEKTGLHEHLKRARAEYRAAEQHLIDYALSSFKISRDLHTVIKEAVTKDAEAKNQIIELAMRLDTTSVPNI